MYSSYSRKSTTVKVNMNEQEDLLHSWTRRNMYLHMDVHIQMNVPTYVYTSVCVMYHKVSE